MPTDDQCSGFGLLNAAALEVVEALFRGLIAQGGRRQRRGIFELAGSSCFTQRLDERLVGGDAVVVADGPEITRIGGMCPLGERGTVHASGIGTKVGIGHGP